MSDLPQDVISHIFSCFWIHCARLVLILHRAAANCFLSVCTSRLCLFLHGCSRAEGMTWVCPPCFSNQNPLRWEKLEHISTKIECLSELQDRRKPCRDKWQGPSGWFALRSHDRLKTSSPVVTFAVYHNWSCLISFPSNPKYEEHSWVDGVRITVPKHSIVTQLTRVKWKRRVHAV